MKAVKEKLPEECVADFEKAAQTFAKKIVANFKDYEFVSFSHPSFIPVDSTRAAVHRRVHEPRRFGGVTELPRRWRHS